MIRSGLAVLMLMTVGLAATGCTTKILRPSGETDYVISCSPFGWHACYERANRLCSTGYQTELEYGWGIRNELRISCPGQRATP
jgi:hypothetical protein